MTPIINALRLHYTGLGYSVRPVAENGLCIRHKTLALDGPDWLSDNAIWLWEIAEFISIDFGFINESSTTYHDYRQYSICDPKLIDKLDETALHTVGRPLNDQITPTGAIDATD